MYNINETPLCLKPKYEKKRENVINYWEIKLPKKETAKENLENKEYLIK